MGERIAAEVFPPGEFLKDELEARGWSQVEFADIIDKDTRLISEVISGKRAITPETAIAIGTALGTGPEVWMNLEGQFQLSKVRPAEDSIARKAVLHGRFPVREMAKRGWIESTKNVDILEAQLLKFFGMTEINDVPALAHAAKKTTYAGDVSIHQLAWLQRARNIALGAACLGKFSNSALEQAFQELKTHLEFAEGVRQVSPVLSAAGVRVVVVESFPGSKIDGACFWLDKSSPVVALSLRFDRVDNFWHTVFHELDHVKNKEGMDVAVVDSDIMNDDDKPDIEIRANQVAAEQLISKAELDGFIVRVNPMFSEEKILGFAKRIRVHPGIVVGQLQNAGLIHWKFHRKHLEKIRELVTGSLITDGFGRSLSNV